MSLQNKAGYGIEEEPLEPTSLFEQQSSEGDASLNTVDFSEGEDANLTSGSTLSVLFGKIKYFINNIASYFGNIITASASVDNSSGTPSVTVTKTVTQDNKIDINFEFTNLKGADGTDGVGIASIVKTGTSGLVDTYTITFTDNTTSTFTVTNGTNGVGVPTGGTAGQVLSKVDGTDYNTQWVTPSGGGPTMERHYVEFASSDTGAVVAVSYTQTKQYDLSKDFIQVLFRAVGSLVKNNVSYAASFVSNASFRFDTDTGVYRQFFISQGHNYNTEQSINVFAMLEIEKAQGMSSSDFKFHGRVKFYDFSGNYIGTCTLRNGSYLDVRAYYFD